MQPGQKIKPFVIDKLRRPQCFRRPEVHVDYKWKFKVIMLISLDVCFRPMCQLNCVVYSILFVKIASRAKTPIAPVSAV